MTDKQTGLIIQQLKLISATVTSMRDLIKNQGTENYSLKGANQKKEKLDLWVQQMGKEAKSLTVVPAGYEDYNMKPTLRDQFAMAALQGIISSFRGCDSGFRLSVQVAAESAYEYADAMLKVRGE